MVSSIVRYESLRVLTIYMLCHMKRVLIIVLIIVQHKIYKILTEWKHLIEISNERRRRMNKPNALFCNSNPKSADENV